jgi:branched-chain amino acid transport system substrate-binding protein
MCHKSYFFRLITILLLLTASQMNFRNADAQEKKEILIGANLSLTGPLAMDGAEQKWAYEQAVADINKTGGIFVKEYGKKLPVKLVTIDDESDGGKAAAAVEKLIKMLHVDLMLSTHSTPLLIPSCLTAEKYKKYYHATTCIMPPWLEQKFKWSTNFFIDMPTFAHAAFKVMDTLTGPDKIERPALLMEDTLDGRALGGLLREWAPKYGYKLAVDEPWAVGAKDYSSQILKLKNNNVDAMLVFGSPTDCITLIRQMKEADYSVKYFHGWKGTWTSEFWYALGKDAQYVMCDGFWSETFPYPGAKELGERYTKKYNKQSVSTGLFYATAQILWQAIEKAGTLDSAKVREAVVNHEFKGTVMGDVKYNPDGSATFPVATFQWWNGKQMLVYPFMEGGWKTKVMPPWNKR